MKTYKEFLFEKWGKESRQSVVTRLKLLNRDGTPTGRHREIFRMRGNGQSESEIMRSMGLSRRSTLKQVDRVFGNDPNYVPANKRKYTKGHKK